MAAKRPKQKPRRPDLPPEEGRALARERFGRGEGDALRAEISVGGHNDWLFSWRYRVHMKSEGLEEYEIAQEFQVSEQVVAHQLQNQERIAAAQGAV